MIYKPSEGAPHTSNVTRALFEAFLDKRFYRCIEGAVETSKALTASNVDIIVFTGGSVTGKYVAAAAAMNLTPCILELGGKCPCIVDSTANLQAAMSKICSGKFLNAGQTCIAPDHLWVEKKVLPKVLKMIQETLKA